MPTLSASSLVLAPQDRGAGAANEKEPDPDEDHRRCKPPSGVHSEQHDHPRRHPHHSRRHKKEGRRRPAAYLERLVGIEAPACRARGPVRKGAMHARGPVRKGVMHARGPVRKGAMHAPPSRWARARVGLFPLGTAICHHRGGYPACPHTSSPGRYLS